MLLVDDHQPEVLELHVLGQQLVRADDDVDAALGDTADRRRGFLGGAEARQFGELHRPLGEAVAEVLEVLLRQQRGGHEHRHLLAIGHGDEGGAQRHLGLAEADVAADQPVHRLAGLQVLDHGLDGGRLVDRLLEGETGAEGLVVLVAEAEGVTLAGGAARVEVEQFGGGVAHLGGGLAARLLPVAAAELVERHALG